MNLNGIKDKIKEKAKKAKTELDWQTYRLEEWAKANPYEAATVGVAFLGAVVEIGRRIDRNARVRKEAMLKNRFIYDRSLGSYWKLRRVPTQSEMLKIERLRKSGMSYGDILTRLKLI